VAGIEAEIKGRVRDPDRLHAQLSSWADPYSATYSDTYFRRGAELVDDDRELRVRQVSTDHDTTYLLTYKGPTIDAASGSKGEWETSVGDAETMCAVLGHLGFEVLVAFTKCCTNYRFERDGRSVLATVVTLPEVDGTFVEVETIAQDEEDLDAALLVVRDVLRDVGIGAADFTTDTYTAAVLATRG
jgi:adenylate cyclase class 2